MPEETPSVDVALWRGEGKTGRFELFSVPRRESQSVLDVVIWIQHNRAPTLAYRYACRVGMCGSCAMTVNGLPRWTCRTHVRKVAKNNRLEIAPLRNLPPIRDLLVDMDPFFEKWIEAQGVHQPSRTREEPIPPLDPESPQRREANAGIECINCAVCYAACDTVAGNPNYLGPAALQRAWTLYNDEKHAKKRAMLKAVSGRGGCHNCHSQGSCARFCPNGLEPMRAIAGLKRATAWSFLNKGDAKDA